VRSRAIARASRSYWCVPDRPQPPFCELLMSPSSNRPFVRPLKIWRSYRIGGRRSARNPQPIVSTANTVQISVVLHAQIFQQPLPDGGGYCRGISSEFKRHSSLQYGFFPCGFRLV